MATVLAFADGDADDLVALTRALADLGHDCVVELIGLGGEPADEVRVDGLRLRRGAIGRPATVDPLELGPLLQAVVAGRYHVALARVRPDAVILPLALALQLHGPGASPPHPRLMALVDEPTAAADDVQAAARFARLGAAGPAAAARIRGVRATPLVELPALAGDPDPLTAYVGWVDGGQLSVAAWRQRQAALTPSPRETGLIFALPGEVN